MKQVGTLSAAKMSNRQQESRIQRMQAAKQQYGAISAAAILELKKKSEIQKRVEEGTEAGKRVGTSKTEESAATGKVLF